MREVYILLIILGVISIFGGVILGFILRKKYLDKHKERLNELGKNKLSEMSINDGNELSQIQVQAMIRFMAPMFIGVIVGVILFLIGTINLAPM